MKDGIFAKILKRTTACLLLLLFVGYYVDVNFFVHSHTINGVSVVHSHLHNSNHQKSESGGHSATQIDLITCHAGQFISTEASLAGDFVVFFLQTACLNYPKEVSLATRETPCVAGRAPPAEMC